MFISPSTKTEFLPRSERVRRFVLVDVSIGKTGASGDSGGMESVFEIKMMRTCVSREMRIMWVW